MKKIIFILAIIAAFVSCTKEEIINTSNETQQVTLTTNLNVDKQLFTRSNSELTSTALALTDFIVYDYVDSVLIDSVHQTSTANTNDFGTPTLNLKYGKHTLYVVTHKCTGLNYDPTTYMIIPTKYQDTFIGKVDVNVTTSTKSISCTLNRAIWKIKVTINDAIPTGVSTVNLTITSPRGLNIDTFLGSESMERTVTINASSVVGQSGINIYTYGFAPNMSDEFTTNLIVSFKDASGNVIQSHTKEIPLQDNYMTALSGNFFGNSNSFSVQVNSSWGEDKTVEL